MGLGEVRYGGEVGYEGGLGEVGCGGGGGSCQICGCVSVRSDMRVGLGEVGYGALSMRWNGAR